MRSARWPSARNFCARGVPDFRKFCKFFARFFAQNLRHLDAGLARYLALERTPTRQRAATKFCSSRNHAGQVHATSVRAARRNFSETLQFFRANWAQNLRDPDAERFFFFGSDCKAGSINSQRRCEACAAHAGRMHAFFCARDVPDFRKFAIFSREFCAKFA